MGKTEELSNAQCLRVIGQCLEAEPVSAFRLTTFAGSYIVSSADLVREPESRLLPRISRRLFKRALPTPSDYLIFARSDLLRLDEERKTERKPGSPLDRRDLSWALRIVGDYLDRKRAAEFAIDWSRGSIVVRYDGRRESFTHENLYNFGVHMYLRRVGRIKDEG